jgi:hypothetical protein
MTDVTRTTSPLTETPPRPHASDHSGPVRTADAAGASVESAVFAQRPRRFPGWRWVTLVVGIPLAGYIGWGVAGHVDSVGAALIGGALTGAGLGVVQWWAAGSALSYAAGLTAGAALVGYDTDLGSLAVMGLVSGAVLGCAQGAVLVRQRRRRLALAWGPAMPVLFALGWCASTAIGVDVDDQFTVFGASGAIVFTLLSGVLLAHFTPTRRQPA